MWSGTLLIACSGALALTAIDYWTETKRIPEVIRWLGVTLLFGFALWSMSTLPMIFIMAVTLIVALVMINQRFYRFLVLNKYPLFAVAAFPLHVLYFIYCGVAFGLGVTSHFLGLPPVSSAAPRLNATSISSQSECVLNQHWNVNPQSDVNGNSITQT